MIDLHPLFGTPEADCKNLSLRAFPAKGDARWLLESRFRRPWHLETWPRVNQRARLIYKLARVLGAVGLHLPSRRVSVPCAAGCAYAQLAAEFTHLGIFLGTKGHDRKIVIFAQKPEISVFVKIPTGPVSEKLVQNEFNAISRLQALPALAPMLPKIKKIAGFFATEDMASSGARFAVLPESRVAEVHDILFEAQHEARPLASLGKSWMPETSAPPDTPLNDLISRNAAACVGFLAAWPENHPIMCYMAHGDLTRWNALVSPNGTPQIIDWELYGLRPKYFDLIHYVASAEILVKRHPAAAIMARLQKIGSEIAPEAEWGLYVGLYFLFQSGRYAPAYATQADLHKQALWQLQTWTECLKEGARAAKSH